MAAQSRGFRRWMTGVHLLIILSLILPNLAPVLGGMAVGTGQPSAANARLKTQPKHILVKTALRASVAWQPQTAEAEGGLEGGTAVSLTLSSAEPFDPGCPDGKCPPAEDGGTADSLAQPTISLPPGGGTAVGLDGKVRVTLPPGAVEQIVEIYISWAEGDDAPPTSLRGQPFRLTAYTAGETKNGAQTEVRQFKQPLAIQVQ